MEQSPPHNVPIPTGLNRIQLHASVPLLISLSGVKAILHCAELSGDDYKLESAYLDTIPSTSKSLVSVEHIERLRDAKIHVIVSSQSGAGLAVSAFDNLLKPLFELFSINYAVHYTSSKTSHREYLGRSLFSRDHENVIIIFGGDTMIYDFLNSLPTNRSCSKSSDGFTLFPIPCGTGNALAMSLGITSIPIGISKVFGVGEAAALTKRRLPVMEISIDDVKVWGLVVCSWGFHASVVADSDDMEMRRQYGLNRFNVAPPFNTALIIGCSGAFNIACASRVPWHCKKRDCTFKGLSPYLSDVYSCVSSGTYFLYCSEPIASFGELYYRPNRANVRGETNECYARGV